jgi:uncharacterized protein (DUF1015 family)
MLAMDDSSVVPPPYLGGPLLLHAFRGLTLVPRRIGGPSSAKALARPYRDIAARLASWERSGQLLVDAEPALYLHEYTAGGLTVRGLVGALDLVRRAPTREQSAVVPHEGVHSDRVDHLAERMQQLGLQPAPILLVHRGPEVVRRLVHATLESDPDRTFTDRSRQHHRIWAIRDPATLRIVADALAPTTPMIADGHHRYSAYLRLQSQHPGTGWDRGLAMLVDQDDTPLFLGAIHRVLPTASLADIGAVAAAQGWVLRILPRPEAVNALAPTTVVVTDGAQWAALPLPVRPGDAVVDVLHDTVIPGLPRGPGHLGYHHSVDHAVRQVRRRGGVAVLMPAPDFDLVSHLVAHQRLLPEKATSFQPKPSVGSLMRSLHDG